MKKTIVICSVMFVLGMLLMSSNNGIANQNAAPGQSPSACATSNCHNSSAVNSGIGSVVITDNIPSTGYIPGQTYSINVTVAQSGISKFGFGFEAVNSSNTTAGTLVVTNAALTKTLSGTRVNMTHLTNSGLGLGAKSFTFNWIAPAASNGTVTFYSAGNAANGNNSDSGDFIYTTTKSVTPYPLITGSISGSPFCGNASGIAIPYTASGTYSTGNVFTAELSDATGSFASPTTIGSVTATTSGTIISSIGLPNIAGTAYRVRVVSSLPAIIGTINSSSLTIQAAPSPANAGSNQSVCGTTTTLSANTPAIGTGSWSLISGTGLIASAANPSTTITGLSVGPNVFRWTISNASCASSVSNVTITSFAAPSLANAGSSQTICTGSALLNAAIPATGTGQWSLLSGSATILSPFTNSSSVTGIGTGTNIFAWTVSNGNCVSNSATVALEYSGSITVANAGNDQTVCGSNATLNANQALIGTGSWSVIAGTGNFAAPNSETTSVSGLSPGLNVFRWIISNGVCSPTADDVSVTSVTISSASVIANYTTCSSNASLSANSPQFGNGGWTVLTGSANITSAGSTTTAVTNLNPGQNSFLWTISNAPCPASTATLDIVQSGTISNADAGIDQSICGFSTVTNAQPVSIGTGSWSVVSGSGIFANNSSPFSGVTAIGSGTNVFRWTVSNASCTPLFDDVTIITRTISTAVAGPSQTICSVISTLTASQPVFGTGSWVLLVGSGSIFSPTSAVTPVINLGNGINVFRYTISNSPCPNSVADVTISNCVNNSITTNSVSGSPFCANSSYAVLVSFTTTGVFPGFYTAQLSDATGSFNNPVNIGASGSSPISAFIPTNTPTGTAYRIRVINSNPATIGSNNGTNLSINTCVLDYITLDSLAPGPYCDYTSYEISIPFETAGNTPPPFTAQLSDSSGSFVNPLSIGYSYVSPINAQFPRGLAPGDKYKIRIKCDNPSVISNESLNTITVNICLETGLSEKTAHSALRFYPSITQDVVKIVSDASKPVSIAIMDLMGRTLLQKKFENGSGNIHLSDLSAQTYFIVLKNETETVHGVLTKY